MLLSDRNERCEASKDRKPALTQICGPDRAYRPLPAKTAERDERLSPAREPRRQDTAGRLTVAYVDAPGGHSSGQECAGNSQGRRLRMPTKVNIVVPAGS